MATTLNPQLSFDVEPHPHSVRDGQPYLEGGITVAGEFYVRQDLQPGDELIKSKGNVIGTTRLHKVKLAP
jgi:hypothetical protein